MVLALGFAACGGDEASSKVAVPEINGAVALEDFCDLFEQIQCAGADGCCSDTQKAYASVDACLAASSCAERLADFSASKPAVEGALVYDPEAAGDYLRSFAASTAACGASEDLPTHLSYFVGTRVEGADCTPDATSAANTLTCKPGLGCILAADAKGTCMPVTSDLGAGAEGDACETEDDCAHGDCVDGACALEPAVLFCEAPPAMTPPSNATVDNLYIKTADSKNAGTTANITLTYDDGAGNTYTCTITGGIGRNAAKTCTPTASVSSDKPGYNSITIEQTSTDGLRMGTVCARDAASAQIYCAGSFHDPASKYCTDWDIWDQNYGSCYIDADDNGNCKKLKVYKDWNYVTCL